MLFLVWHVKTPSHWTISDQNIPHRQWCSPTTMCTTRECLYSWPHWNKVGPVGCRNFRRPYIMIHSSIFHSDSFFQALQAFSRESVKSAFCPICPFRTLLVWPWTSPCEMLSADDFSSWRAKIAPKNCFSEACGAYSIELQSRNSAATGSVKKNWASPCSDVKSGCDFLSRFCDQQKFRNVLILIQVAYISYITLNVYHMCSYLLIFLHISWNSQSS